MRRARGSSPPGPFRALAHHHHAGHGSSSSSSSGQHTPESVSALLRAFNVDANPTRPIRPSPLTASPIPDMPLDLLDRIRSFPLFMAASDEFLVAICRHLRPQVHSAHDHILTEGDDAKAMYWIVRGAVAVTSRDGEAVYAELKPGAFFGEIGVLMDVPRTATIVARTKCLLVVLKKEDLQAELPRFPSMEKAIRQEAEERLNILKKKRQERSGGGGSDGGDGGDNNHNDDGSGRGGPAPKPRESVPGEVSTGDVGIIAEGTVINFKKRKSPSPSIIEDPAVGGSALGAGYVNVRKTLKELPLFATLPPDILHFLGLSAQPKAYPPFTDIVRQGTPGNEIYFIVKGEAEVVYEGAAAVAAITAATPLAAFSRPRLTQGQYFGEVASLGLSRGRTATVRAITSVECLVISGAALDEFWKRCPPALRSQVEQTANERYNQQRAAGNTVVAAAAPTNGDGVTMSDAQTGSPPPPQVLSIVRRHSVPHVTFTAAPKPAPAGPGATVPPTNGLGDEPDTRQPSDPDPFLSVDMENLRNRRRNSLAPPTGQQQQTTTTETSSQAPAGPYPGDASSANGSAGSNAHSSPLKFFSFPPQSPADTKGPDKGQPGGGLNGWPASGGVGDRGEGSAADRGPRHSPFKKVRTLAPRPTGDAGESVAPMGGQRTATTTTTTAPTTTSASDVVYPPAAVLIPVFQQLDLVELIRLQAVCRAWRTLLRTSPQLCTHVDLSPINRMITDWSLATIVAPFLGPRPVEMDISNCFKITDEGFQALWQQCGANVKAWRMKSVWSVSANQILDMCEHAAGLEEVDWSNCRTVGDNLLARVVGWVVPQPAQTLGQTSQPGQPGQTTQTTQATPTTGPPPGTVIGCPNLKILDLSYCKYITDRSMVHLAAHASNRLRSLTLTRCTWVTDAGFQMWGPYRFNLLTHLCLADCTYLTDNAVVSLVNAAKNLTHLDLSFCCALSDTATEVVALGLPMLQELRLAFCGSAVSDASLRCVALHLNDLRGLSVRGCVRVTGVGVEHVLDGCGRLAWLDMSQCKNVGAWVQGGGIGRWGYDERQVLQQQQQQGLGSPGSPGSPGPGTGPGPGSGPRLPATTPASAWKAASRRSLGLDAPARRRTQAPLPSMRGQRRRARQPVKFILEKGAWDGLR